jgi:hypothetical protein
LLRTLVEGSYENFSFNHIAMKSDFPCYHSQVEGGFALVLIPAAHGTYRSVGEAVNNDRAMPSTSINCSKATSPH